MFRSERRERRDVEKRVPGESLTLGERCSGLGMQDVNRACIEKCIEKRIAGKESTRRE